MPRGEDGCAMRRSAASLLFSRAVDTARWSPPALRDHIAVNSCILGSRAEHVARVVGGLEVLATRLHPVLA